MKTRLIPVLAVLIVLGVLATPGAFADPAKDGVRQCFLTYKHALLAKDGDKAVAVLSANSLDYYDRMRKLALTGSRQEVQALADLDRMGVFSLRVRTPRSLLETGTPGSLVKYAIDSGMIGSESVARMDIGEITVRGDQATADIMGNGQSLGTFRFHREGDAWKFDLEALIQLAQGRLSALAKQQGMDENELLIKLLSQVTGKEIGEEIWKPLVRR